MQLEDVLSELKAFGSESTKKTFINHGAIEPVWGVKVGDMKTIVKKIKNDQKLAMRLYDTGISDAMYLAGLLANGSKMTKTELKKWAENSGWYMISEYTVPWVACESQFAEELALEWIDSNNELIASSGWNTFSGLVSTKPDSELDLNLYKQILERVEKNIHNAKNRVRYSMNTFVISLGSGVASLTDAAMAVAIKNGKIIVNMGNTACRVPYAPEYLQKIIDMGRVGLKRKTMKC